MIWWIRRSRHRQKILDPVHVTGSLSFIYLDHQKHDSNLTNTRKVGKSLGFDLHGDSEAEEGVSIVVKQPPNTCNKRYDPQTISVRFFCCNYENNFICYLFNTGPVTLTGYFVGSVLTGQVVYALRSMEPKQKTVLVIGHERSNRWNIKQNISFLQFLYILCNFLN